MGSVGGPPKAPVQQVVFAEDMNEATLNKAVSNSGGLVLIVVRVDIGFLTLYRFLVPFRWTSLLD